jgi:HK97 family phage major capsid protein
MADAVSVIEVPLIVNSADATGRKFAGIASTPDLDTHGYSIDPLGVSFTNPAPLLLHHDQRIPIGTVSFGTPSAAGVPFTAEIPEIGEPGDVKAATDRAAHLVKYGLIRKVSVGLQGLAFEPLKDGLVRITKSIFQELSLVTVPANRQAAITMVKSAAPAPEGRPMTTAEQITDLEQRRTMIVAQMTAILQDDSMDDGKQKEYDGLEQECKTIEAKLPRLRTFEQRMAAEALPIEAPIVMPRAPAIVKPRARVNLEPGTAFVRYAMCKAASAGDSLAAIQYAARWRDTTPEVELLLKAATGPANVATLPWAGALVPTVQHLGSEFIDLLRPATVIGRIPGLRRVPFNVQVPKLTGGGTYRWVGEGAPKPVTQLVFATVALAQYKIAGILTFTLELARSSEPSAEQTFRDAMIAGIAQFMDAQFLDPAVALVAGVNPASITNGVTGIPATTDPLADITTLLNSFVAAQIPISGVVLIMSESNAFILSSQRTAMGEPVFPGVAVTGGSINGVSIITSSAAGTNIIGVVPRYVLYADDGGVSVDVSREATVQMNDAPGVPDATTIFRSLWQDNLIGLRAERFVAWIKAHANAVNMITGTAYTPTTVGPTSTSSAPKKAA